MARRGMWSPGIANATRFLDEGLADRIYHLPGAFIVGRVNALLGFLADHDPELFTDRALAVFERMDEVAERARPDEIAP
jgi:hypothetical protein